MKHILLFILLLFSTKAHSQDDEQAWEEESEGGTQLLPNQSYQSEEINVQRFEYKRWKSIVGDQTYDERELIQKSQDEKLKSSETTGNGGRRQGNRKKREFDSSDSSRSVPIDSTVFNIIFYALVITALGYILFIVIKNASTKKLKKEIKVISHDYANQIEDIKELEVDRALREALSTGNYRLAVRIYYLSLLKNLDEREIIIWKKNKTNRDYLSELSAKNYHYEEIRLLTISYELVWYGDHDLNEGVYQDIFSSFKTIDQQLNSKPL